MEVYTHRSRSRSHHHHHPSSASSFSRSSSTKRSYTVTEKRFAASSDNVSASAAGGTQMHPFAPRDEDYSVVFGSFLSGRASSIPMLDLPSFVDQDDEVYVNADTAGFDYSQVFGGLEFDRFGLTCDDLFHVPDCVQESADDESSSPAPSDFIVSAESSNSSVIGSEQNNQNLVYRDCYQSPDKSEGSSNNANHIAGDGEVSNNHQQVHNFSTVTQYITDKIDHRSLLSQFERCSLGTADDIILKEDSSGNISVETLSKSSSSPSPSQNGKHSSSESNAARRNGVNNYFMDQISDIHVGTNGSSPLPVPLRPPHVSVNNLEDDDLSRFVAYERIDHSGSPGFFDVEVVDPSPSAPNSGETEKKPKRRRAQVKMKTFKDLMNRNKDGGGLNGKSPVHKDSKQDHTLISGRSNLRSSSENVDGFSPGAPRMTSASAVKKHARRRNLNNDYEFLGPGTKVGEDKWKEGSQYVELTNNIKLRPLHSLKRGNCYPFSADGIGKPMDFKLQEERGGAGTGGASPELNEGEHLDYLFEPRASGGEFHEGMGNVTQYDNGEVTSDHVENNVDAALSSTSERRTHQIFLPAAQVEKKQIDRVEEEKRRKEVNSGEENSTRVKKKKKAPASIYGNGRVAEADESNDKDEEDCVPVGKRRGKETRLRHEDGTRLNGAFEMEGERLVASGESQEGTMGIKEESVDEETRVDLKGSCDKDMKKNQEMKLQEKVNEEVIAIEDGQLEKSQEKQVNSAHHQYADERETVNGNKFEISRAEGVESSSDSESACCELWKTNNIGDNTDENKDIKRRDCLQISGSENQVNEPQTHPRTKLHVKAEKGTSKPAEVVVLYEGDQQASSNAPADQTLRRDTETDEVTSQPMDVEKGSKAASEIVTTQGMQPEQVQRAEAHEPTTIPERKVHVPFPKTSQSLKTSQLVGDSSYSDNLTAGEEERYERQERVKREFKEDHLRKLEEERERERERAERPERARRAFEEEHFRKLEEERDRAERLERGRRAFEEEHLRKLEEERERAERLERGRRAFEEEHLRKLEEERERAERLERARRAFEEEHLRKLEEEREREREREKDRMKVELEIDDGRRRALAETRERATVERATAEARQRAMAEARERLEKACADARGVSSDHNQTAYSDQTASYRLRAAEGAAVERATAEARERAFEKAKAERAAYEAREQLKRSISDKFSLTRHYYPLSYDARNCGGVEGETDERCNARLQRHCRTAERVAEALAEKNKRDLIAQREQAERNRLSVSLNAEIKRWSNGKEGNLRALLSTLQHILGPDSGWQPISLTEILTPTAAKKAYRKATLCVHPDKLQQRGATIQQKYICEKVFDLLKDAWNKFNSGES